MSCVRSKAMGAGGSIATSDDSRGGVAGAGTHSAFAPRMKPRGATRQIPSVPQNSHGPAFLPHASQHGSPAFSIVTAGL
eukprot:7049138-Prymnesium_polylepis.1